MATMLAAKAATRRVLNCIMMVFRFFGSNSRLEEE